MEGIIQALQSISKAIEGQVNEKLAFLTRRQDNTTNITVSNQFEQVGFAQTTATTAKTSTVAITFPEAFDSLSIIVNCTIAGYKVAGASNNGGGSSLTADTLGVYAENINVNGFTLRVITSGTNLPNVALIVNWRAVGTKAR